MGYMTCRYCGKEIEEHFCRPGGYGHPMVHTDCYLKWLDLKK